MRTAPGPTGPSTPPLSAPPTTSSWCACCPIINQAVEEAISAGEHAEELAQVTLQDHAMLMDFFRKGDARGAEYAMAIHMRHAMDEMELEE